MIPYSLNPMGINPNNELSDLDTLRQIRDANPTSVLNIDNNWFGTITETAWLESRDPSVWWGITWLNSRVETLNFYSYSVGPTSISTLPNINNLGELKELTTEYSLTGDIILSNLSKLNKISLFSNNANDKILNVDNCISLTEIAAYGNALTSISLNNCPALTKLIVNGNKLTSLSSLTSKGSISDYNFTNNYLTTVELNRLRSLGFTDESKLLPQNP